MTESRLLQGEFLGTFSISGNERQLARESFCALAADGIVPRHITTDPDSGAFNGAMDSYCSGNSSTEPVHQLDPPHVNRNIRKHINGTDLSVWSFPNCKTRTEKQRMISRLSHDLTKRCHGEHKAAMTHYKQNTGKVQEKMVSIVEAIVRCYQNDHSLCLQHSFLCGGTSKKNYLQKNVYLGSNFHLSLDKKGEEKFRHYIIERIGKKAISMMKFLSHTQKCEAVNRSIGCRVPKHLTYSRNYDARVHAAVKAVNCGLGQSICDGVLHLGGQIPVGSTAAKRLYEHDKSVKSTKEGHDTLACKQRLRLRKRETYRRYDHQKAEANYKSGSVLETLEQSACHEEHCYSLRRKYVKC